MKAQIKVSGKHTSDAEKSPRVCLGGFEKPQINADIY